MKKLLVAFFFVFSQVFAFDSSVVGKGFLDFTSKNEQGKEMKASQIINHKPAVIVFFALGDQPGTFKFMPHLNSLYEKYKDKVVFMAVLLSRSNPKEVKKLKEMLPLKLPVYLGYSDAVINYKIQKVDVPMIIFVNKKGIISHIVVRPESTEREIHPSENIKEVEDTIQGRISQSIQLIERYISYITKEN